MWSPENCDNIFLLTQTFKNDSIFYLLVGAKDLSDNLFKRKTSANNFCNIPAEAKKL